MDEHFAIYQVVSGMPGPTYLIFIPMKSLEEADLAQESHKKPYQDALGEEGRRQLRDFTPGRHRERGVRPFRTKSEDELPLQGGYG